MRQRRFDRLPLRSAIKKSVRAVQKLEAVIAVPERRLYESGHLSMSRLRMPDFLGIGGIKSASTWLYENLRVHPELYLPERKELHYFTLRRHKRLTWYSRQFEPAGDRVTGEITPGYGVMSSNQIAGVARLLPDLKTVLIIRNPVDRAWSHAVMKLSRERHRPVEAVPDEEFREFLTSPACMAAGDYGAMIDRWNAHYPADRLLVAVFDDVEQAPRHLLETVFGHLGVSTDVEYDAFPAATVIDRGAGGSGTLVGKTDRPHVPERFRELLEPMYADATKRLAERIGGRTTEWV